MDNLKNGTLNYFLTKKYVLTPEQINEINRMDPTYPDPNDSRFTDPAPVFTIQNNQLYRDGNPIGRIYNNKTGKIVTIDTITEDSFFYKDTSETAIITQDISVTTISKLTGLKPYQSFCKLTLSDDSVVELKGSGELTPAMVNQYKNTLVSVEIGELCSSIGEGVFSNCNGLTTITIPNSVTSIGNSAFYNCRSLSSVTIPSGVTSIGVGAFNMCSSLVTITVNNNNSIYDSRNNCNAIIETATNTLIAGCKNTVILNSVTSIGSQAFSSCTSLTTITIPNSVTSIEYSAFQSCTGLTSITIPDSVTSVGEGAFAGCTSLTSATIGNGVTSIDQGTFAGCTSLTSVIIGNSVTTISTSAFANCTSLTNVIIPNNVTSIGNTTFASCTGLTSITIGNNVTSIGNSAFSYCSSLTNITSLATTSPTIQSTTFYGINTSGTLYVPQGSTGYDTWMGTGNYYLGKYNWTKVEQS